MPVSNATIKSSAHSAPVVNPSSYVSGFVKTVKDTFNQISGSFKSISTSSATGHDIREMDEKLLNDIGLTANDRGRDYSNDFAQHHNDRMFWY